MKQEPKLCVAYKLHKDKSPITQECDTQEEQIILVKRLKADGYNPIPMTAEQGIAFLLREGKRYEPKPLTAEERWFKWALGN
jgi:hypothetical protein